MEKDLVDFKDKLTLSLLMKRGGTEEELIERLIAWKKQAIDDELYLMVVLDKVKLEAHPYLCSCGKKHNEFKLDKKSILNLRTNEQN